MISAETPVSNSKDYNRETLYVVLIMIYRCYTQSHRTVQIQTSSPEIALTKGRRIKSVINPEIAEEQAPVN